LWPEVLGNPQVQAALDRCAQLRGGAEDFEALCQRQPAYADRREDLQCCFFQVTRASAVYVVAHRLSKAEDAGLPPLDLGGNVGWAAQMYVDRFKPLGEEDSQHCQLYLFDNSDEGNPDHLHDAATAHRWSYWQVPNSRNGLVEGKWIPFGTPQAPSVHQSAATAWKSAALPPAPCGFYAGMGTTSLPWSCSGHEEAFANLYAPRAEGRAPKPSASRGEGKGQGKGRGRAAAREGEEVDV